MVALKEGVKMAWDLLHDSPTRGMIERVHGWTNGMVRSSAALEQAVSMSVHPSAHFTGTARMGLSPDAGAVAAFSPPGRGSHHRRDTGAAITGTERTAFGGDGEGERPVGATTRAWAAAARRIW